MKRLGLLVLLLALALAGAWLWHALASDPGYVLIALHGTSYETTLVVAVAAVIVLWLLLWLALILLRFPLRYWQRRRRRRMRQCLANGLVALHEGRWRHAEKLLGRAAHDPGQHLPALLAAARAAQQRGDDAASDALLARAAEQHDPVSVALLAARRHQQRGDSEAIVALFDPEPVATLPPRAVQLYLTALADVGRASDAVALLPALRASRVLEGEALEEQEATLQAAALQQAPDGTALNALWNGLSRARKSHARVVAAYARRAAALDEPDAAVNAVEKSLRVRWSPELVAVYGLLPRSSQRSPLKMAEAWLAEHPDDPGLLVALGRLCRAEQLWGKATEYLHRALTLGAGARAWEELGHVHAAQHDDSRARDAYAKALALQHEETAAVPAPRSRRELIAVDATPETRSSMGVPLPPEDAHDAFSTP